MDAPLCPHCNEPITRALDVPYGWWEWNTETGRYEHATAATRVDVAPWVHAGCMGELRQFHPQNRVEAAAT